MSLPPWLSTALNITVQNRAGHQFQLAEGAWNRDLTAIDPKTDGGRERASVRTEAISDKAMRQRIRQATIATLGNAVEWFDFVIFGFMALAISKAFFPSDDPLMSLIAALGTFGAGFIARPVGAVIFGRLGDRRGRRFVLIASISIMAAASFIIGVSPTYAQAGVWGAAILVFGRLLQGVSAGAEFGNAIAYLIEWAPSNRKGLFGSLQQLGAACGLLFGALVTAALNSALTQAEIIAWGWRIPFLLGGMLALAALFFRLRSEETPEFKAQASRAAVPLPGRKILVGTLQTVGLCALWTVAVFASVLYMPTFAQQFAGVAPSQALWATVIGAAIMIPCVPLAGAATDRFGVRAVLAVPVLAYLVFAVPGFALVGGGDAASMLWVVCGFAILAGIISGAGPVAIGQIFPAEHRSTWTSIGAALAITFFGGFAPLTSTLLIRMSGWTAAPGIYIMAMALLTAAALLSLRRSGRPSAAPGLAMEVN